MDIPSIADLAKSRQAVCGEAPAEGVIVLRGPVMLREVAEVGLFYYNLFRGK